MTRPTRIAAAVGLLALALALAVALNRDESQPSPLLAAAPAGARGGNAQPRRDVVQRYRFRWETSTRAPQHLAGSAPSVVEGATVLAGVLTLGTAGEGQALELRLPSLDTAEVRFLSGASASNADQLRLALVGHRAWLTQGPHGALVGVTVEPAATPLFANLALALAGELQHERRPEAEWTSVERTARGLVDVRYQARSEAGQRVVVKERVAYRELVGLGAATAPGAVKGQAEFRYDEGGTLERLVLLEELEATGAATEPARSVVRLTLTRDGTLESPVAALPTGQPSRLPGQAVQPADAAAQHLAQRVDGLTPAELTGGIDRFVALGQLPDQPRFLIRATGLLQQQPALAAPLGERAAATASSRERAFVLDLLAGAGTPEAQAALRRAVTSTSSLSDRERVTQFARLALVEHPTPETVAFVDQAFSTATGKDRLDRALVLGAVANALATDGQPEEAAALGEKLAQALSAAGTPAETAAYLRALGNAGLEAQVPQVLAQAGHPDPLVRGVAAYALRKTPTPPARQALLSLTGDPVADVQRNALHGLGALANEGEVEALAAQVRGGALSPRAAHDAVTALAPFAANAAARAALAHIAANPAAEAQLRERVRTLLEEAPR